MLTVAVGIGVWFALSLPAAIWAVRRMAKIRAREQDRRHGRKPTTDRTERMFIG